MLLWVSKIISVFYKLIITKSPIEPGKSHETTCRTIRRKKAGPAITRQEFSGLTASFDLFSRPNEQISHAVRNDFLFHFPCWRTPRGNRGNPFNSFIYVRPRLWLLKGYPLNGTGNPEPDVKRFPGQGCSLSFSVRNSLSWNSLLSVWREQGLKEQLSLISPRLWEFIKETPGHETVLQFRAQLKEKRKNSVSSGNSSWAS